MAKFNHCRRDCSGFSPTTSRSTGAYTSCCGTTPRTYGFPYSGCDSVFYQGPCPSADCDKCGICISPCGCESDACSCPCNCPSDCPMPIPAGDNYAMLTADSIQGNLAPLNLIKGLPQAYTTQAGEVILQQGGRYFAAWTMNLPANTAVSSTVYLALNAVPLPESAARVDQIAGTNSAVFSGHAIFDAQPGARLRLESSSSLSITGAGGAPLFALTLLRIC